jgi:hypothetical protein
MKDDLNFLKMEYDQKKLFNGRLPQKKLTNSTAQAT